jgi:DNA primase
LDLLSAQLYAQLFILKNLIKILKKHGKCGKNIEEAIIVDKDRDKINFIRLLNHFNILESKDKYKIVCPFHNDVNASMQIDLAHFNFHCFACGVSGNYIDFIKLAYKDENLNDLKAVQKLYTVIKCDNKDINYKKYISNTSCIDYEHYLNIAKDYYFNLSQTNWNNLSSIDSKLYTYLNKRKISNALLSKVKAKYTYDKTYPIIFPLYDSNEFVGYVRRTTDEVIECERKYLYNKGFRRRNAVVGSYHNKTVVIVEGYIDYVRAKSYGEKYVCATLGWRATDEQILKLKNAGVENIISALDNDEYGIRGTKLLSKHFNIKRFKYPKGVKDIGEISKNEYMKGKCI